MKVIGLLTNCSTTVLVLSGKASLWGPKILVPTMMMILLVVESSVVVVVVIWPRLEVKSSSGVGVGREESLFFPSFDPHSV